MKPRLLADYLPQYIEIARKRLHSKEPETPVMPPLHEDLGGLTEVEIQSEIRAIDARIEKGIIQPEGIDGLNYRKTRLEAQAKALKLKQ